MTWAPGGLFWAILGGFGFGEVAFIYLLSIICNCMAKKESFFSPPKKGTSLKKMSKLKRFMLKSTIVISVLAGLFFVCLGIISLLGEYFLGPLSGYFLGMPGGYLVGVLLILLGVVVLVPAIVSCKKKDWSYFWYG